MPYAWMPGPPKKKHDTYFKMMQPVTNTLPDLTPLTSGCNRPLQMTFEDQINIHAHGGYIMQPFGCMSR